MPANENSTKLFYSLNTDALNALYLILAKDQCDSEVDTITALGKKLASNTKDAYLASLIELQSRLECANLQFRQKKAVKMTCIHKRIMIADATEDDELTTACIADFADLISITKDPMMRDLETQIINLKERNVDRTSTQKLN